jgi:hypothetical protein
LNGCQKNKVLQEEKSEQQRIEEVQKWISEQKNNSFVVQDGKILSSYYSDVNGNRVSDAALRTGPGCYVDDPLVTAEGVKFDEVCGSNPSMFSAIVSFTVSADNAVVAINPATAGSTLTANRTRGRLQMLNSTGTQLFNQANIWGNLVITDLGVDPNATTRTLFRVTFQADNIPGTVLSTAGWQAKVYLTHFSECEEDLNPYPFNIIASYGYPTGLTACNIINKVWVNPGLRSVSGCASNLNCTPSLYSNRQEIEIYASNGTTLLWKASDTQGPAGSISLLNATDTKFVPTSAVATGQTIKIRYRNVQINTSTGSVLCRSSWLSIFETWVW